MDSIEVQGFVDGEHHLTARVPGSIPAGPVTIMIKPNPAVVDESEGVWMDAIAQEWAEDLADERQDIYTLTDGEAIDPT
jgi:hypothetical protein